MVRGSVSSSSELISGAGGVLASVVDGLGVHLSRWE